MSCFSRGPDPSDRPDDHEPFRRPTTAPVEAGSAAPPAAPSGPRPTAPPERPPPAPPPPIDLDAPYGPPPQPRRQGRRPLGVALVVLLCLLSFGGGYLAHAGGLTLSGGDEQYAGSPEDPIEVDPGEAFEIDGTLFREGWVLPRDRFDVRRLVAYNDRDDEEPVRVSIDLALTLGELRDATITCVSDGALDIGESQTLSCQGDGDIPPYLRSAPITYRVAQSS